VVYIPIREHLEKQCHLRHTGSQRQVQGPGVHANNGLGLDHGLEPFDKGGQAGLQQLNQVLGHGIVALESRPTLAIRPHHLLPSRLLASDFRRKLLVDPFDQEIEVRH
jgi:hypothetical protein